MLSPFLQLLSLQSLNSLHPTNSVQKKCKNLKKKSYSPDCLVLIEKKNEKQKTHTNISTNIKGCTEMHVCVSFDNNNKKIYTATLELLSREQNNNELSEQGTSQEKTELKNIKMVDGKKKKTQKTDY